ncbi:MAG TPA: alpha/beta hydrolase [Polyangiaceae bacterium]|nr:alpha/beta hydrolase [Polyangiaceae bacterium]
MNAFVFVLMAIFTFVVVAVRRLFKGPLHPGWSYRYEAIVEILRKALVPRREIPVHVMRKQIVPSRIHPKVRALIDYERGTLGDSRSEIFTPKGWKESDPTLLYFHGGGYIVCSPATHRDLVSRIAVASGARAIAIDYRKAPEHPFPLPIDDCETAYRALLDSGVPAERIFVGGDSAGGGLTLAVLLRLRDAGLPLPRAGILLSPWVDLECQAESIPTNARYDYLPATGLEWGRDQYLQGQDWKHPHASPVHADLRGLPPLLMQTGSAELFLAENQLLAERAKEAGVPITHEVEPGMIHVFQAFASFVPECEAAILRIGAFVREQYARAA